MTFLKLLRRPVAFLPLAMSLAALATVLARVALVGVTPDTDEGTAAHVFQLLIAAQVPLVGLFAARWLPEAPGVAARVLALQVVAALAALAPVFLLQL